MGWLPLVSSQRKKKKQNDKLGAFISQQISSFENHKASITAKENLLSLRATGLM